MPPDMDCGSLLPVWCRQPAANAPGLKLSVEAVVHSRLWSGKLQQAAAVQKSGRLNLRLKL